MKAIAAAELLERKYMGGEVSDDSAFIDIDFQQAIQNARGYKIKTDYWMNLRMEGERIVNNSWLVTFPSVAVAFNETNNSYYSVLPAQVYGGLPRGMGLYFISATQNINKPFIPLSIAENWLYSTLPQDETIYYNFDDLNVYYTRFDPSIKSVFMKYIPLTADYIPDDFVYEVIDLALTQFLKARGIEDKINDQNPNTAQAK